MTFGTCQPRPGRVRYTPMEPSKKARLMTLNQLINLKLLEI